MLDVAIIGGGPGGLAAAHALKRAAPKLSVGVFERTPAASSTTRRGAGFGLDINGHKATFAIDPALHARAVGSLAAVLSRQRVLRPDGSVVFEGPLSGSDVSAELRASYAAKGFKTPCLMGWYEWVELLREALPPDVAVTHGASFERFEEVVVGNNDSGDDAVVVHFHGGSPPPVAARLLVAADGYYSRVRRQANRRADGSEEPGPVYGGSCLWRARLPGAAARAAGLDVGSERDGWSMTFVNDTDSPGRFVMVYPVSSGDVVWTAASSDERMKLSGLAVEDVLAQRGTNSSSTTTSTTTSSTAAAAAGLLPELPDQGFLLDDAARGRRAAARCLQALDGFPAAVRRAVELTPPSHVIEHGIYTRPAEATTAAAYGRGRVVVIGDAAHPVRPTGQGLNTVMEDAHNLAAALVGADAAELRDGAALGATLDAYREARAARMRPIVAYTTKSGEAAYKRRRPPTTGGGGGGAASAEGAGGAAAAPSEQQQQQQQQEDDGVAEARNAMSPDAEGVMTAAEFARYAYTGAEFEDLAGLLQAKLQQQQAQQQGQGAAAAAR